MTTPQQDDTEFTHRSLIPDAIGDIEAALEISLPDHYKLCLKKNPLKGTDLDEDLFWTDVDRIVARNLINQKTDWFGRLWPNGAFQIGDSCDQGAVFIDLRASDSCVYFYHWEMNEDFEMDDRFKVSSSIPNFVEEWQKQQKY